MRTPMEPWTLGNWTSNGVTRREGMSNQGETWLGCSRIRWAFWNLSIVYNLINIRVCVCVCVQIALALWRMAIKIAI